LFGAVTLLTVAAGTWAGLAVGASTARAGQVGNGNRFARLTAGMIASLRWGVSKTQNNVLFLFSTLTGRHRLKQGPVLLPPGVVIR